MAESASNRKNKHRSLPIFWQITALVAVILFLLLGLALSLTLQGSLSTFQRTVDDLLGATVATLAESPSVWESLDNGVCPSSLTEYLDSVVKYTGNVDYITLADAQGRIIYNADHSLIGMNFPGEQGLRAMEGESFFTDEDLKLERGRFCFGPVVDAQGRTLGFVMTGTDRNQLRELRAGVYSGYIRLFVLLMGCSLIFTGVMVVYLKRHLRGVRAEDLLRLVLIQNDILNNLDEGMVALDDRGRIRMVNRAASEALGRREELLLGRNVDDVLRTEQGESLWEHPGQGLRTNRTNILANSVLLPGTNPQAQQVLILMDRSEAFRQAEQLNGTRHIISALRANNHEYLNRLQVISGLLQMGYTKEALNFIGSISATHIRTIGPVMQLIDNANVAALILGKMENMRELDIELTLLSNSRLPEHSRYLSTGELVTVVGNLLENAIEAVDATAGDNSRSIVLQITEDDRGLFIMISDSGTGIEPEDMAHIYTAGFSTKAKQGRGVGMALVKEIVDRRGGSIDVDTEPGSGTSFALIFNQERGERK